MPIRTQEEEEFLARWYEDDMACCQELIGTPMFETEFNVLHREIYKAFARPEQKKLVLAPRSLGKSTIVKGRAIKKILFRECHFILYISSTLTIAEMATEHIKNELLSNELIRKFFGSIRDSIDSSTIDGVDDSFSKKCWTAFGDILVLPRGCDQQVRGLNWKSYRPDYIILDDIEDAKEIENEENRKKTRNWFFSDLYHTPSRYNKRVEWNYIDTLKHFDALPIHLMEKEDWYVRRLSICDNEYNSYVPEFITTEELKRMVAEHRKEGNLSLFYRELMNIPIALEQAAFSPAFFQPYQEEMLSLEELDAIQTVILVDPAKTVTPTADKSAIVVAGIDLIRHKIYVREVFSDHVYPDQLYDKMFELATKYSAVVIGYEVTSLNMFITYPVQTEIVRRSFDSAAFVELKAIRKKEERIGALIPFYRRKMIYHRIGHCHELEEQLLTFPSSRWDDIMDAFAYVIELLDEGGQYFLPSIVSTTNVGGPADSSNYDESFTIEELYV